MNRSVKSLVVAAFVWTSLSLAACSSMSQRDKEIAGTAGGAVVGGIVGQGIAGPAGTIIGATGGAVAGNVIGSHMN